MNKKGQSLLEMVFAIGIMLIVVSAILALAVSNIAGQKASEFQIIANNLGREAIEVVRNIRDSNWLSGQDWDSGLTGGNIAVVNYNSKSLVFDSNDFNLYLNSGAYTHYSDSGVVSGFSRYLELGNICLNLVCPGTDCGKESIKSSCDSVSEQKIGIKVTAVVGWLERGRSHEVKIDDLLYDWK